LAKKRAAKDQFRFGIGEWYGQNFISLTKEQRHAYATAPGEPICPFRSTPTKSFDCKKKDGVCSLRTYQLDAANTVTTVADDRGRLRAVCPKRLLQNGTIFSWVGEVLLGTPNPLIAGEVGFLEGEPAETGGKGDDVGRIDHVLVHPIADPLRWCALELQAVYFSGKKMGVDIAAIARHKGDGLPFPVVTRRPDYRSSGPKRLMPQLQIKVPSLRRWGKKMAVVVDEAFFDALGRMDDVRDVSNCDIAWFIVGFDETETGFTLRPRKPRLTTLERAVEGLTGGTAVSCETFEERVRAKLAASLRDLQSKRR
jgi:hypothetical protein